MNEQTQTPKRQQQVWKSVTVRLKENDLAVLNNKLRLNGFETFSEFFIHGLKANIQHMKITNKFKISLKELEIEA